MTKPSGQTVLLGAVVAASCLLVGYLLLVHNPAGAGAVADAHSKLTLEKIPFNGQRAYGYLTELCELGPRISDTPAMSAQQKLLTEHFEKLGAKVRQQPFRIRHPETGQPVNMANIIVQFHPERRSGFCSARTTTPAPFPIRIRPTPAAPSSAPTTAAAARPC